IACSQRSKRESEPIPSFYVIDENRKRYSCRNCARPLKRGGVHARAMSQRCRFYRGLANSDLLPVALNSTKSLRCAGKIARFEISALFFLETKSTRTNPLPLCCNINGGSHARQQADT